MIHNKQGKIPFKNFEKFKYVSLSYMLKIIVFMWQLGPEQQGNCHRSALLISQLGEESHIANHLLFEKDDFCTTFLVSCQLADPKVAGQMAYKFIIKSPLYMKQNTPNNSFEVNHLYYLQIMFKKWSFAH